MSTVFNTLRGTRLTGGIFLDAEFSAPWCVAAQVTPEDCRPFMPVPQHIIAYHYVAHGDCVIALAGQPPATVSAGGIAILPRNPPHFLASALNVVPVDADHLIQPGTGAGPAHIEYGGGGEVTHMLCGFLGTDTPGAATVAMLPDLLIVGPADWTVAAWTESSLRFAVQESAKGPADSGVLLVRLAELLLFVAIRQYLALRPGDCAPMVAGMRDVLIGRALRLLHHQMCRHWTTEELASEIGLSRSSFADRFVRAVGEPPMRYLARQRLDKASLRLLETSDPICRIAYEVGYESEAAFNRAFRREYGSPPSAWRRGAMPHRPESSSPANQARSA